MKVETVLEISKYDEMNYNLTVLQMRCYKPSLTRTVMYFKYCKIREANINFILKCIYLLTIIKICKILSIMCQSVDSKHLNCIDSIKEEQ